MSILIIIILTLYAVALSFICIYSLVQLHLLFLYRRQKRKPQLEPSKKIEHYPSVTIQLPIYNERYVISRLIDQVVKIDYPKAKLEIQVLDDSDDETAEIIADKVNFYRSQNFNIKHIRRSKRVGFKAGALAAGLQNSEGDFIAIFDADFLPSADFLTQTLPYFEQPDIGMVQTRWSYINPSYSLFTALQAFGLNAHFSVEQAGRNSSNLFINFNGTGGIWRKTCIVDGGGWSADTLSEDLDLSYRCQFKGWKMKYLENSYSPAELPVSIAAIKSQQRRWSKGAAEVNRRYFKRIWQQSGKLIQKIHATFHLMGSSLFLGILTCALLSVPLLFIKYHFGFELYFNLIILAFYSFIILILYYWEANQVYIKKKWFLKRLYFLAHFLTFLTFSMSLSLQNSIAVLEAYFGKRTPFKRTPKFNITSKKQTWKQNRYIAKKLNPLTYIEGFLSIYFFSGLYFAYIFEDYGLFLFHLGLSLGFGSLFIVSLLQVRN